jgi:hypothetical protein
MLDSKPTPHDFLRIIFEWEDRDPSYTPHFIHMQSAYLDQLIFGKRVSVRPKAVVVEGKEFSLMEYL